MPLKSDATGRRWVEIAHVLPGPPEAVWAAMCTGPGLAAWFTPGTIEPRVGGAIQLDFGEAGTSNGFVTAWEPPARFAYVELGWDGDAPPCHTDVAIAPRPDGTCAVVMTHALHAPGRDDQLEGFERGWPAFFEVLGLYLRDFAGQPAASFQAVEPTDLPAGRAWQRLLAALDLHGLDAGDARRVQAGPEAWDATVEAIHQTTEQRTMLLRLADGLAVVGVYGGDGARSVGVTRFRYGAAAAAPDRRAWQAFVGAIAG